MISSSLAKPPHGQRFDFPKQLEMNPPGRPAASLVTHIVSGIKKKLKTRKLNGE
jgi:hypothetical protein